MEARGYESPEEALAAVEAAAAQAEPQAALAGRWQDEVESLTGTGTAEAGHVRAVVDVQGMLTGLVVGDVVASRGGRVVTAAVRTALRAAQEDVRRAARASAERAWGPGSATAEAFGAEVERATVLVEPEAPESDGRPQPPDPAPRGPSAGGTW